MLIPCALMAMVLAAQPCLGYITLPTDQATLTIGDNYPYAVIVETNGTLNVNGGTITSDWPEILPSVTVSGGTVNMKGGALGDRMDVASGTVNVFGEVFQVGGLTYGTPGTYEVAINGQLTGMYEDGSSIALAINCMGDGVVTLHVADAGGPEVISVDIEVPCSLNINGHGLIPVYIFGTETFDVANIEPSSLGFNGLAVRVKGNGAEQCSIDDVDGDGHSDLVCHFVDDAEAWVVDQAEATLSGLLCDGVTEITGTTIINVVNEPES